MGEGEAAPHHLVQVTQLLERRVRRQVDRMSEEGDGLREVQVKDRH